MTTAKRDTNWPTTRRVARTVVIGACLAAAVGNVPAHAATAWRVTGTGSSQAHAQSWTAPSNVTATCANALLSATITVNWNTVTHASSYSVYESTTSATSGYSLIASGITTTSCTSGALTSGRTYWHEVVAVVGNAWQSPTSAATTGRKINTLPPFCQ
jgi:fibronectin type 3 domain-containing protein